jgi:SAM-dependent methyltransferase
MTGFSQEWDEIYNKDQQLTSWPWSDLVSLVFRYCRSSISKNGLVFELGCGNGPNIPFIQSIGMSYYGVEGSPAVVKKLHKTFPELRDRIGVGDFTKNDCFVNLPKVDIVIDRASVTHNNQVSIANTLRNSYDLLKSDGYFIGIDWFSTKHSAFLLGKEAGDTYTRNDITGGQFENVGNVHFSDEKHLRSLFSSFDIISLEEKIINTYEPNNHHQFASWNIVARKK